MVAVDPRQALGKRGEDIACKELKRHGYDILDRRFRTRCGELDIVARDHGVLVFVEVRARSGCRFGSPFESVTSQKRRRVCAMAESYLFVKHMAGAACRFDVHDPPRWPKLILGSSPHALLTDGCNSRCFVAVR